MATPKLTSNNGVPMPIIGFGVHQISAEQTDQARQLGCFRVHD